MRFQNYPNIVHKAYECVELFQNGHVKSYLIKCSKCCCARSKLQINLYFGNMSATRHGAKKKLIVQKKRRQNERLVRKRRTGGVQISTEASYCDQTARTLELRQVRMMKSN